MGFIKQFSKIDRWCSQNILAYLASGLILLGILFIILTNKLDFTPAFQDLKVISGKLSEKPYISGLNKNRVPVRGWIKIGSKYHRIDNICFLTTQPCHLPGNIRDLKIGDQISIWTSKSGAIWQIKNDETILISYHQFKLANQISNQKSIQVAQYFFVGGGILILMNFMFRMILVRRKNY